MVLFLLLLGTNGFLGLFGGCFFGEIVSICLGLLIFIFLWVLFFIIIRVSLFLLFLFIRLRLLLLFFIFLLFCFLLSEILSWHVSGPNFIVWMSINLQFLLSSLLFTNLSGKYCLIISISFSYFSFCFWSRVFKVLLHLFDLNIFWALWSLSWLNLLFSSLLNCSFLYFVSSW